MGQSVREHAQVVSPLYIKRSSLSWPRAHSPAWLAVKIVEALRESGEPLEVAENLKKRKGSGL